MKEAEGAEGGEEALVAKGIPKLVAALERWKDSRVGRHALSGVRGTASSPGGRRCAYGWTILYGHKV